MSTANPTKTAAAPLKSTAPDIDLLCIDTIRTLSMDAVQAANSGHPGGVRRWRLAPGRLLDLATLPPL